VITGPIAPPTILIIFVTAEEIPVYSLGENEMIVLINVVGNSAPAIPNIKSAQLIASDEEWNNKSNKNETAAITHDIIYHGAEEVRGLEDFRVIIFK
jgi:hypothetical protein